MAERFLGSPWAAESVWRRVHQSKPAGEKALGPGDLPLSRESKRVLALAVEEADQVADTKIRTGHLLLAFLREESCLAAEILNEGGAHLDPTRKELARLPHDDAIRKNFLRERAFLPDDIVEIQNRIRLIARSRHEALANQAFEKARVFSDEEQKERDNLLVLCEQRGLLEWLFT